MHVYVHNEEYREYKTWKGACSQLRRRSRLVLSLDELDVPALDLFE
jgi:hypothetical protein